METKFQKYLANHGYIIKKQFCLADQTVTNWKKLDSAPTAKLAYMLILYSRGDLTMDDIYTPYAKKLIGDKKIKFKFQNPDYADQLAMDF